MFTINGKKSIKTALDYVNDFNLSNPPDYGFFVVTSDLDLSNGNPLYTISFAPTLTNNGTFIVKKYDLGNNVVESKVYYSGTTVSLQTKNDSGTPTQYGTLTKWSIEAVDGATKPITSITLSSLAGVVAYSFGNHYWDAFSSLASVFLTDSSLLKVIFPSTMNTITSMSSCFQNCYLLEDITMPTSMSAITTFANAFNACRTLNSVTLPTTLGVVTSLASMFQDCNSLKTISFPATMDSVTTMANICQNCYQLTSVTLPTSMTALTSLSYAFSNCRSLQTIVLPAILNNVTNMEAVFFECHQLTSITLPTSSTGLTNLSYIFSNNYLLVNIPEFAAPGTNQIDMTSIYKGYNATTFDQSSARASKLVVGGAGATAPSALTSIEIDWANSTYGGAAPQIDLRYNNLDKTEIDRIFTALPIAAKTINVAGNPGAATCDQAIATAKTWTVVVV